MPEPTTMVTVARAAETTPPAGEAVKSGGNLGDHERVGAGAVGSLDGTVASPQFDPSRLGESMLGRAESSGDALSEALRQSGTELASPGAEVTSGTRVFDAARWSDWKPPSGELVNPQGIAERFRPLRDASNLESYARHLEQKDPSFAAEVGRRRAQMAAADSPAARDNALRQVSCSTAGKLGEAIAKDGLMPYFKEVELQRRVETPNGTTFVDFRCTGARQPMVVGRGRFIPEGGNLSVEVKTGQAAYLDREVGHIVGRQVPGHIASGDVSLTLFPKDVHVMSNERGARDAVAGAGSYVLAVLPEKRMIDEALVRVLFGGQGKGP